jgi:Sec-independent protein translocase protein TatA
MGFFGVGSMEILVIALVAFLILGPVRMLEVMRTLGSFLKKLMDLQGDVRQIVQDIEDESLEQTSVDQDDTDK